MKKKKNKNFIKFNNGAVILKIDPIMFKKDLKHKDVLDKEIAKEFRGMLVHFKKDGWDLSLEEYVNIILDPIVGRHAKDYITASLLKKLTKHYPDAHIIYDPKKINSPLLSKGRANGKKAKA